MRIAVGGLQKNFIEQSIKNFDSSIETIVTNDMNGAKLINEKKVDYYFGACESGGGSAISILIALVGFNKCCTVTKAGGLPNKDEIKKFVKEGKVVFGMTVEKIEETVPLILNELINQK
ncbi:DUF2620 family protein [uncultured Sneathia sp.]|jgi:hypothetical protein|uniref:DUF2620 family protein n=1 Tax=Sneathia vaginalis TaxID=187101 RepID=UPI0025977DD7|nr:DUF2620 family protein [uncultured Sneathia sp.]MCT7693773.1 DUF2620 domain-containing protein [Lactobacillus iners]